eukprot:CAMPEP_0206423196 /NCGR_PEP_ID=MMETSP0324_2-20121206/2546_1 /ASSEMBLY_ACC=CAM_ASM_000836 /TAXON_ID=2866 /ORGANISM="Crypthecodinium cohnii, Strain Seligo" /LENGTH=84 /DNA_ID=CAMNT_0053887729 /DNA_START=8 /DNA_END=262 /DNA_ORIENTATION=+
MCRRSSWAFITQGVGWGSCPGWKGEWKWKTSARKCLHGRKWEEYIHTCSKQRRAESGLESEKPSACFPPRLLATAGAKKADNAH